MKLDEFDTLSNEEKENFLKSIEGSEKTIADLTAERDSFKTENQELKSKLDSNSKELKATKEMNFTLARKIDAKPAQDPESILYNIIKEFN